MSDSPADGARFVEVAVPVPIRQPFTYRVPSQLVPHLTPGARVAVPFGRRKLPAFVVGHVESVPDNVKKVRDVAGVLDDEPVFPSELLNFLCDAARYYMHPIGEVLKAAAPAVSSRSVRRLRDEGFLEAGERLPTATLGTRVELVARLDASQGAALRLGSAQRAVLERLVEGREVTSQELRGSVRSPRQVLRSLEKKGLITLEERRVVADPFFGSPVAKDIPPPLNDAQATAVQAILDTFDAESAGRSTFLLQGVTGSGKTEVYLRVIEAALAQGRGGLLLVPEIALTPQLVSRFRARLGDAIAVLHSALSDRERQAHWEALRSGRVRLAIGARSAVFAPVADLGVVVVDEEHDGSFKQEEGFRYHARDLAILRASRAGAVCVLGSATPSLETRSAADQGRVHRLLLPARATGQTLPEVEVVDLARHREGPTKNPLLSAPLLRALEGALERGEQSILFLNRRGFASAMRCDRCGQISECPACSVPLTEHRHIGRLVCHYCDYSEVSDRPCRSCGATDSVSLGLGTEQLEAALSATFSGARVLRLDRDTATGPGVERILDRFRRGDADILVGTQMVTKGHDLPRVTFVGVILADQSLGFPDFRAGERTFQLLSQVAGRAGRADRPGHVVFQTFQPEHPAVRHAAGHDFEGFYRSELECRRELGYSPFSRLVAVRLDAGDEARVKRAAAELAGMVKEAAAVRSGLVRLLGPAPAPIGRLRGRYRFRFLLRSQDRRALRSVAGRVVQRLDDGIAPVRGSVDIDPVSML